MNNYLVAYIEDNTGAMTQAYILWDEPMPLEVIPGDSPWRCQATILNSGLKSERAAATPFEGQNWMGHIVMPNSCPLLTHPCGECEQPILVLDYLCHDCRLDH